MADIYSWNVNGIRAAERKGFLDWLQEVKPDVLCLQETKAWKEQLTKKLLEPEGYKTYWSEALKKGYSGVAIYSRVEPKNVTEGLPQDIIDKHPLIDSEDRESHDEGRVITAEYQDLYVVSVYTPNSKDDLSRIPLRHEGWDPAFLEYMQRLEKNKPVVFCGDLNVAHTEDDLARPKQNEGKKGFTEEEREGIQKAIDAGYLDSFRLFNQGNGYYTWWTHWANARERNVGWRIDYCMVSDKLKDRIKDANIHPDVMGSDHCPVSVKLDVKL